MKNRVDLTKGPIIKQLINLALPIIGTSFLATTYSLIDIFWISKLGSDAVAGVGTASFFIILGYAFTSLPLNSTGIRVSQEVGKKNYESAKKIGLNGVYLTLIISIIYISLTLIFRDELIGFFKISNKNVINYANSYFNYGIFSALFTPLIMVLSKIFNGYGNSKTPFYINAAGLIFNIILDPLIIFGYFFFPELGVKGAAIATIIAKLIITIIYIWKINKRYQVFNKMELPDLSIIKELSKLGFPILNQRVLFTSIGIYMGRIVSSFGEDAIAAQKLGLQIEAISFMTAGGFQGAMIAFIGQNFGVKNYKRIFSGYKKGMILIGSFALIITFILTIFSRDIISLFIKKENTLIIGANYLFIIGLSQLFLAFELTTVGAANGIGKTKQPAIISIIVTVSRIPLSIIFAKYLNLGINGVWGIIAITTLLKGLITPYWYINYINKNFSRER